jgi:hypothetical protein
MTMMPGALEDTVLGGSRNGAVATAMCSVVSVDSTSADNVERTKLSRV